MSSPEPLLPRAQRPLFLAAGVLISALVARVALSPRVLLYDEPWYMAGAELLRKTRLDLHWLRELPGSAGPLYQLVHFVFAPLTNLSAPWVRFVSVLLLLVTLALVGGSIKKVRPDVDPRLALLMLGVPFLWVSSGMALTELPSVPFLVATVLAVHASGRAERRGEQLLAAAVGGVMMGVAFSGRQPLIACAAPLGVWLLHRRRIAAALVFGAFCLPIPLLLVVTWGGLVPPKTAYIGEGISLLHGVLSFAYAGVALFFLNPSLFRQRWPWLAGAVVGAFAAALGLGEYQAAMSIAQRVLPAGLLGVYPRVAFGLLLMFAVAFVAAWGREVYEHRDDRFRVALAMAALLLLIANAKVTHQFSSRYIVPILPLLMLTAGTARGGGWADAGRVLLGAAIGFASLESYYHAN